jgi:hypothetical protein
MFGGFIMNLPSADARTSSDTIGETLAAQEQALAELYERSDFSLLNIDEIRGSG